jgi:hypothetical protein
MGSPIIIVEIPHQMPAKAWTAYGWDDAASRTVTRDGQSPGVTSFTFEELISMFGDIDAVPAEALVIAREHGSVVEVNSGHDQAEWVAPNAAPSLADTVREWIAADLNSAYFLESAEEARQFIETYAGHQGGKARAAARREAEREGWIATETDEDEDDEV